MRGLWQFLSNKRVLTVIALAVVGGFLFLSTDDLEQAALWVGYGALAILAAWLVFWSVRKVYRRRAAGQLRDCLAREAEEAAANKQPGEVNMLRKSMLDAISTIKTSKLGLVSGAAALYELPWYMIIGNPSAGKSSAIANSALHFPITGNQAIHGVGGTRNCDWFFTTDGILLDTAGRYSVEEGDRAEWFSFLALLRKYRKRAPINGILICVSVAELTGADPADTIELAKRLRARLQEVTERLGVFAPVYLVFTKVDLVAGFRDFFHDSDGDERKRAWGATLRYNRRSSSQDVLAFFDQHFDELHDGLKELSLAQMEGNRSARMRPGVFTFPLEFAAIKSPLRAFLATLFEENTYQFKPVFRGFYFVSAVQEGEVRELSSHRVSARFDLSLPELALADTEGRSGYFLHELFRKIVFADKDLVARYTRPGAARLKYGAFFAATIVLGCALGGWTWSNNANRQLVANVRADMAQIRKLQENRIDLQSRLEALGILQDRLEQLDQYKDGPPLMMRFGLYQGDRLAAQLRAEYFHGMSQVMLAPVLGSLEAYLAEMNANGASLVLPAPGTPAPALRTGQLYQDASPTNAADGYNALKTYLMLENKTLAESGHLNDQLTRFWRGWLDRNRGAMPREDMIRSAERLMSYYLAHVDDPGWPRARLNLNLRDTARVHLNAVYGGSSARDRVYNDIRTRAATRFAAMTVVRIVGEQDRTLILGSQAVSGAFTRDAWEKFVRDAIREAATRQVKTRDAVLDSASTDDLTLIGSPEQIEKTLTDKYKADYIAEWTRFVQGVAVAELSGFDASVQAMNRLGDPQTSPIARLLRAIDQETAWDRDVAGGAGGAVDATNGAVRRGLKAWFRETILRRAPSEARSMLPPAAASPPAGAPPASLPAEQQGAGAVARAFSGVARVVGPSGTNASLLSGYLDALSHLRSRLNQIKLQGDAGPGAKQLMQQTLAGNGSELADALKYVDEQMLVGMSDQQRQALRPILVRPLMQTFAMIVLPSEAEINKTWQVQVLDPFRNSLQARFPFTEGARVEASAADIGRVFGPEGAIAKFVSATMGPLVVRRGDAIAAQTWADMGIFLDARALADFPRWIAPLDRNGAVTASGAQTVFQLQPLASSGTREYTIEIDGQQLRYRNTPPVWVNMVHPGPAGPPGARISATTDDGRSVEVFNEPGQFGLRRMIDAARSRALNGDVFELRWTRDGVAVGVELKIVSSPVPNAAPRQRDKGFAGMRLPAAIVGHPRSGADLAVLPGGAR